MLDLSPGELLLRLLLVLFLEESWAPRIDTNLLLFILLLELLLRPLSLTLLPLEDVQVAEVLSLI